MRLTPLNRIFRIAAQILVCTILTQSIAFAAPKALTPQVVKEKVEKRGAGKGLKVVETDGTKVTGRIGSIGTESFTLEVKGVPQPTEIAYAKVSDVHNTGLSTGAKIAIIVTAGVAITVIVAVIVFERTFKIGPIGQIGPIS